MYTKHIDGMLTPSDGPSMAQVASSQGEEVSAKQDCGDAV